MTKNSTTNFDKLGSFATSYEAGSVSTTSDSFVSLGDGPECSIIVPESGAVLIEYGARMGGTGLSGSGGNITVNLSGAYTQTDDFSATAATYRSSGSNPGSANTSAGTMQLVTGMTPGETLTALMRYQRRGSWTAYFEQRYIIMQALPSGSGTASNSGVNFAESRGTWAFDYAYGTVSTSSFDFSSQSGGPTAALVVPSSGIVRIKYGALMGNGTQGSAANATINYSGAYTETDNTTWSINYRLSGGSSSTLQTSGSQERILTGLTPGETLTAHMRYQVGANSGTAYFSMRFIFMEALPG